MKNIFWKKCHTLYLLYIGIGIGIIGIVIGRYEKFHIGILSVLADMKKSLSVVHCVAVWHSKEPVVYLHFPLVNMCHMVQSFLKTFDVKQLFIKLKSAAQNDKILTCIK